MDPQLLRKVVILNGLILALVGAAVVSPLAAFAGGVMIVLYLTVRFTRDPREAFFLFFGTKLTFDALWHVRAFSLPGLGSIGLLDLIIVPVILMVAVGPKLRITRESRVLWFAGFYLFWVVGATLMNGNGINLELGLRQAGILFGLVLGMKYIEDQETFDNVVMLVFLSSVIPVLTAVLQNLPGFSGLPVFYHTESTVRGLRTAGLYYDSATLGMVSVISLFCNVYILSRGLVKGRYLRLLLMMVPLTLVVIFAGATRSVMMVALGGMVFLTMKNLKRAVTLLPLVVAVVIVMQPYIERAVERSAREVQEKVEVNQLLTDRQYRGIFTGRMYLWQNVWKEFNEGNDLQLLFGHGAAANAHSTYFFLLMQIGWFGLAYYLAFNAAIVKNLLRSEAGRETRDFAVVSAAGLLLIGISMTTVKYTSYQWITFMFAGSVLVFPLGERLRREAKGALTGAGEPLPSAAGEGAEARGLLERAITAAVEGDAGKAAAGGVEVGTVKLGDVGSLMSVPVGNVQEGWAARGPGWRQPLVSALKWGFMALAPAALLMLVWAYVQRTQVADFPPIVVAEPAREAVPAVAELTEPESARALEQGVEPAPVPMARERAEESITRQPLPVLEKVKPPVLAPVSTVDELYADAEKYFGERYLGKAEKICEEIIEREPREERAYFLLGDIYLERGEFGKARMMYEMAGAVAGGDGGE
jgi:hypothetical protein